MTISIGRFRRFETILHALIDTAAAEVATNLAGLFIEAHGNEPGSIPLKALADRYGQSGEALQNILTGADDAARLALGFSLLARGGRTYILDLDDFLAEGEAGEVAGYKKTEPSHIALSREFLDVLTGASAPRLWLASHHTPRSKPDTSSAASIALLRDMAKAGGAPFLYRQAESDDPLRHLEMTGLADALASGGDVPVYVAATTSAHPGEAAWTAGPPLLSLLSTVLHLPEAAIILFPFTDQLASEERGWADEEETLDAPSKKSRRPCMVLTHQAKTFLRILPHLAQTVIFTLPSEASLRVTVASAFAGAIGPLQLDRAHLLEQAMTAIPGQTLSIVAAERLLDSMTHPCHALTLLKAAGRLAGNAAAGKDERAEEPRGEDGQQVRPGGKTQPGGFDTIVAHLASSMAPIVDGIARTRPKRAERFDPDLFPSEPDMADYFAHADQLREAGAKFLIHGLPGSGKTAIASELASRMELELKQISGDMIFARWWGATERLIRKTFEDAAAAGNVLLFFDEADALFIDRSREDINKHLAVTVTTQMLKFMDPHPLPIIAATNFLSDIDKAIIRRFDIVVGTTPLPKEREIIAWQRILALDPPAPFSPIGNTVVADYVLTKRRLALLNRHEPLFALQTLREVRDARGGAGKPSFGFLTTDSHTDAK